MAWSYSGNPSSSPMDAVRFLVGDTNPKDQQLQNEEINYTINLRGSVWGAAAQCCRSIAAGYSRRADTVQGQMRTSYSATAKAYMMRALEYEQRDTIQGGALPYAGGISISDKIKQESDQDRKLPEFNLGMDDNGLPIGPGGNQLESSEDAAS